MAKLLPKKILDSELLNKLVRYYRINPKDPAWNEDEFMEWECFSHPSLELHECNSRSKLPGGHTCEVCEHVVGRPCLISCDFQSFCLAVFAWRIGIGGEDFDEALHHNLYTLRVEELYDEVIKKFSMEEAVEGSSEVSVNNVGEEIMVDPDFVIPTETKERSMEDMKKAMESLEVPQEEAVCACSEGDGCSGCTVQETVPSTEELLTITEAAKEYGCTYANIYNYVKAGKLPSVQKGRRHLIDKATLLEFRDRPRSKKAKKSS